MTARDGGVRTRWVFLSIRLCCLPIMYAPRGIHGIHAIHYITLLSS
jgi:hypothetical protein